jgi:hypothetical protein
VFSEPLHLISDLVAVGVAALGVFAPVDGNLAAQRPLSAVELSVIVLSAKSVQEGDESGPGPKAQQKLAQSANPGEENDELFARAVGRTPKWKSRAEGLLPSGGSTVVAPAVDGAAKAAAHGAAGTPRSGKPRALDKRKVASRARVVARANEAAVIRRPTETARPDERTAIQSIIRKQFDAFASDNGARAYSFAAPSIKMQYPNPATFISMVRDGYAAVYRHKRAQFGELSERGERRIQAVRLTDHDGGIWTALYTLEKQPDGSWLISGCTLARGEQG